MISARPGKCSEQKSWNCHLAESGTSMCSILKALNLSLEEKVRRKLILAGIMPKFFNLGQGAIGETIEAAGAGQFGRLHKEALKLHDRSRYNIRTAYAREESWCSRGQKSKNDPAPTTGFSSDCDDLACGVASGGEAKG